MNLDYMARTNLLFSIYQKAKENPKSKANPPLIPP